MSVEFLKQGIVVNIIVELLMLRLSALKGLGGGEQ